MSHIVHLGDCIDGMRTLAGKSVDHAICDPPYSEHVHSRSRRGVSGVDLSRSGTAGAAAKRNRDLGFASLSPELMARAADQFARVSCRWVLVFCDVESSHLWSRQLEIAGLEPVRIGAWIKVGCTPQFTGDRPATGFEAVVIAHQSGRKRWNGGGRHAIWTHPIVLDRGGTGGGETRVHTTQKPLALMESLIADFTDPGDLVLDPFAGSGTTGVACKRLGRRFIGWEIQEKYQRAAQARIDATREQLELVRVKAPKAKQGALALGDG